MYTIQATDGVRTQEKRLMGYNTQIVDEWENVFELAMIVSGFAYYANYEESDENDNTIVTNDKNEILDLYKDADYWKDIDENNEVFVWAKISTNGTKSINDDEAVVFPGNYSVFKDHAKIFILDGEIIVKEK